MKKVLFGLISIAVLIILLMNNKTDGLRKEMPTAEEESDGIFTISGVVQPMDTMETIFEKYNLNKIELAEILHRSKNLYNLSKLSVGNVYLMEIDRLNRIQSMQYGINDMAFLKVVRMPEGFSAERVNLEYNKKIGSLFVNIKDNLIFSMPSTHNEYLKIALELSDIYAWDIDFVTDIRNGDSVKIIVEELWLGEVFKGYGNILAAEFLNNGKVYQAYRFEHSGNVDYYDSDGKSLRKALLRSPLKFKYISSHFSKRRFHPILRIYRPHLGVDYVAPIGTPVLAAGGGTVLFASYKGQYGKMVRIRHNGGYETYYGHLSRIPKKIKKGAKVSQGDIIGYVGSTGLSTGPHLDYRVKLNGRFINPLKIRLPRGESIPKSLVTEFKKMKGELNTRLALLNQWPIISPGKDKISG